MGRDEKWKFNRFRDRLGVVGWVVVSLLYQSLNLCWSLNDEGLALLRLKERVLFDPFGALTNWSDDDGEIDPCLWFGVECSEGKVLVLNLRNLCLEGTLPPELRNLLHIKSIILRNNSFTGTIPEGFGELKDLEVLDLGYNNFSGPLPPDLGTNLSLTILLLDNNAFLDCLSPEIHELQLLSEFQVDEKQLSKAAERLSCNERFSSWNDAHTAGLRTLLAVTAVPPQQRENPQNSPPPSPPPPLAPFSPANESVTPPNWSRRPPPSLPPLLSPPPPNPVPFTPDTPNGQNAFSKSTKSNNQAAILGGVIGGTVFLLVAVIGLYLYTSTKLTSVGPWATGLSGQLQKAFVTGVPKLKRSEVEAACEDFSNLIASSPIGTLYKGTLSSGVEIAVASLDVKSPQDWPASSEMQFRKKIDSLSKANHKNFINLLGYCEEEEPFTRLVVFEYAPNGLLFEHLHIKEAEHLDWGARLRIAMGMSYCLEHMHELNPPIVLDNLTSSSVHLSEDYAAKISDFSFYNGREASESYSSSSGSLENNVNSFGVILFEMMTGRMPYSTNNGSLEEWASNYLNGEEPLREMVDPTLVSFQEEQLEQIGEVLKSCTNPEPRQRPTMREVSERLRSITGITPDVAVPRLSPLWWAELEIISVEVH